MLPLDEKALEAAGDVLDKFGRHHGWFGHHAKPWCELDPIGRDEFLDIVAAIVSAYMSSAPTASKLL